jgi:hypothetical protein
VYDNPSSYAPDSTPDYNSPTSYLTTPSSGFDSLHFNINNGPAQDSRAHAQNGETMRPEASPNSPAPAQQSQPVLVSQPQI